MGIKILLIDNHALFCEGLRCILRQLPDGVSEILEAGNFPDGLTVAGQHSDLDLVLLELNTPGSGGAISVKLLRQRYPRIPVVVVSSEEDCSVMNKALSYGAGGFVSKKSSVAMLMEVLNQVLYGNIHVPVRFLQQHDIAAKHRNDGNNDRLWNANKYNLTKRQIQVLRHLIAGLSCKEIAGTISLAEGTVKTHISTIYQILRVNNRMDAMRIANQLGLSGVSVETPGHSTHLSQNDKQAAGYPSVFEPESGRAMPG